MARVRHAGREQVQKLASEITQLSLKRAYPPKGIQDAVLSELLNCAFLIERNNVAACSDLYWDLKDLCRACGQNSYTSKSGMEIIGIRPNYEEAAEIACDIATQLGFEAHWTAADFPTIDQWEKTEAMYIASNM